jgi:hypothetical protein
MSSLSSNSGEDIASWGVFIASGGDDQAITCFQATITLKHTKVCINSSFFIIRYMM